MNVLKTLNQGNNREAHPWLWFARQLETLYHHCSTTSDLNRMELLDRFLESLDILHCDLKNELKQHQSCFPPISYSDKETSPKSLKEENSVPSRVETLFSTEPDSANFEQRFCKNEEACFIYHSGNIAKTGDTGKLYGRIDVNAKFEETFGYDTTKVNDMISWTGGQGFLPWGGDIFAALFVSEADLLVFLRILSLKFQAVDYPDEASKSFKWDIPSSHSFMCWCMKNGKRVKCRVNFKCTHHSYVDENGEFHTRVEMRTKRIDEALRKATPAGNEQFIVPPNFTSLKPGRVEKKRLVETDTTESPHFKRHKPSYVSDSRDKELDAYDQVSQLLPDYADAVPDPGLSDSNLNSSSSHQHSAYSDVKMEQQQLLATHCGHSFSARKLLPSFSTDSLFGARRLLPTLSTDSVFLKNLIEWESGRTGEKPETS
eukprot:CAMPEP_0184013238 /NCGR_PEP_ID=MMETSP0954-20121128/4899_1 /TAXON_ID=627963 /ORGANISM="Aplanochytrium sp, Strain PBS07" /LENGTH=429 /DNA_ID=CAMNT_0026293399 /DNA_START=417 /DNA_END=1706 /DNA_ORIENTATION=+